MCLPAVSRWEDACTAAAILAVDPVGVGGISIRSAAGPIRDLWLHQLGQLTLAGTAFQRVPSHVADSRLLGGLDLAATVARGRPVAERGLLAAADGGMLMLAMAERLPPAVAAKICTALDTREVVLERDGFARRVATRFSIVALDEGIEPEERPPALLMERLALQVDLNGIPIHSASSGEFSRSDIRRARDTLKDVCSDDDLIVALCEAAAAVGIESAQACLLAVRVARAAAALAGRTTVAEEDAATAARLVFAPRATRAPQEQMPQECAPQQHAQQADSPNSDQPSGPQAGADHERDTRCRSGDPLRETPDASQPNTRGGAQHGSAHLADRIVQATLAALPTQLHGHLQAAALSNSQSRRSGRRAGESDSPSRGRPAGIRAGDPRHGARTSVIETLRAAAPWQRIRQKLAAKDSRPAAKDLRRAARTEPRRIRVLKQDFRVIRCRRRNQLTTIFVVDASGSAACNRLAEVKGAVELMLAESYVRRDRVALIAFRGRGAQILLPPTHSLARVKRELASLPGGGGTPTALGLDTARGLADTLLRHGEAPVVVVLSDGRPNITRDGKGNRERAEADSMSAARLMRSTFIASVMVDTAPQPRLATEHLAREMGARYVPLPHVNAGDLANVIHQCQRDGRAPQRQVYA